MQRIESFKGSEQRENKENNNQQQSSPVFLSEQFKTQSLKKNNR